MQLNTFKKRTFSRLNLAFLCFENTQKRSKKSENFKQIEDDYDVAISQKGIAHFIGRNKQIQYWIATENDSVFN